MNIEDRILNSNNIKNTQAVHDLSYNSSTEQKHEISGMHMKSPSSHIYINQTAQHFFNNKVCYPMYGNTQNNHGFLTIYSQEKHSHLINRSPVSPSQSQSFEKQNKYLQKILRLYDIQQIWKAFITLEQQLLQIYANKNEQQSNQKVRAFSQKKSINQDQKQSQQYAIQSFKQKIAKYLCTYQINHQNNSRCQKYSPYNQKSQNESINYEQSQSNMSNNQIKIYEQLLTTINLLRIENIELKNKLSNLSADSSQMNYLQLYQGKNINDKYNNNKILTQLQSQIYQEQRNSTQSSGLSYMNYNSKQSQEQKLKIKIKDENNNNLDNPFNFIKSSVKKIKRELNINEKNNQNNSNFLNRHQNSQDNDFKFTNSYIYNDSLKNPPRMILMNNINNTFNNNSKILNNNNKNSISSLSYINSISDKKYNLQHQNLKINHNDNSNINLKLQYSKQTQNQNSLNSQAQQIFKNNLMVIDKAQIQRQTQMQIKLCLTNFKQFMRVDVEIQIILLSQLQKKKYQGAKQIYQEYIKFIKFYDQLLAKGTTKVQKALNFMEECMKRKKDLLTFIKNVRIQILSHEQNLKQRMKSIKI